MRVLAITKIFPNRLEPSSAPFNRLQFAALGERCELEVLATIPWFPGASLFRRWSTAGRLAAVPEVERVDGLTVHHPRYAYLPKFGNGVAGHLYALSVAGAVLRQQGPFDVLLGSWAYPDGFATVLLAKLLGVPAVIKVHGSDLNVLASQPTPGRRISWALARAARVVAVNRPLAERAMALGAAPGRVDVVSNGVDRSIFFPRDRAEARRALGLPTEGRVVLYVGHITEAKGAFDLVRAFAAERAALVDTRLVLVGDGAGMAACSRLAAELGVDAHLVGAEPHARIPTWLAACDLLALPSWNEGTPNVVLEALACGRRVVATRVGGIPDVIDSHALGALVPARDPEALAEALRQALAAPYDAHAVSRALPNPTWEGSAALLQQSLLAALETTSLLERPWPLRERLKRGARAAAGTVLPASVIVWRGPRFAPRKAVTHGRVALTFDDGPTSLTREYLAVLERYGARATFFLVGELCARNPELVLAIAKEGHELAGHGYTHRRFRDLSRGELGNELTMTRRLLPASGSKRVFVRPPHGAVSLSSTLTTAAAGFTTALWSYDSGDWATENAAEVVARFYEHPVESGDVVLLHEGQTWTLDALPKVLETLRRAGHELVTMGELLDR